jgi:glyoxylase-like metal-dependent hydrolase (beta-lactamase superfamily II)
MLIMNIIRKGDGFMTRVIKLMLFSLVLLSFPASAHQIKIPHNIDELSVTKVAENVYVLHGIIGVPDKDNKGFMSNSSFVVSDAGVVIVDTGGSLKYGEYLVTKIREITEKPVIAIFNTHMHGDHWLGNAALRKAFPNAKIYAHENAINRLKNGEAQQWLDSFSQAIGKSVVGTETVLPDIAVQDGESLKLAGRIYTIHHTGQAHTDNDIMIQSPDNKILFAGDVLVYGAVVSGGRPEDFSAKGQLKAIDHALSLPIDIYIPGHGPTGGREIPEATKRFLATLYSSVQRYYDEGLQDFEMRDKVVADLAEFSKWSGMDGIGRMINFVYRQIEADEFN